MNENYEFGVILNDTSLRSLVPYFFKINVPFGTLIHIIPRFVLSNASLIEIMDDTTGHFASSQYYCPNINIQLIHPTIFKFAQAINEPLERVNYCKYFRSIQQKIRIGSEVILIKDCMLISAEIFFVGELPQIGAGFYIVVTPKLRNHLGEWIEVDNKQRFIITANKILPIEPNFTDQRCVMNQNHSDPKVQQLNQPDDHTNSLNNSIENRLFQELNHFSLSTASKETQATKQPSFKEEKERSNNMKSSIPGILKNAKPTKTDDQQPSSSASSSTRPPQQSLFIEGKEIVIVDKEFIKESTKNQNDVTIIKNSNNHMELAEALGTKWPEKAGIAGEILNCDKPSAYTNYTHTERIKSANIINHLHSRPKKASSLESGYGSTSQTHHQSRKGHNSQYTNSSYNAHNSSSDEITPSFSQQMDVSNTSLSVGSVIEVQTDVCDNLYGVIRWIGKPADCDCTMVGVELENELFDMPIDVTNGTFKGKRYFQCQNGRGLFVDLKYCSRDNRFDLDQPNMVKVTADNAKKLFGEIECPIVPGKIPPLKIVESKDLEQITGSFKGIQGHHNSCYLDATLFAMFTFTSVFDSLLYRPADSGDNGRYEEVQAIIRDEIVNPLRKNKFVRADRVLKLREILEEIALVTGFTNEEKDPEEFLNILLAQVMRVEPFLKLNSGQDTYCYQLFVEKHKEVNFPTLQELFEQSFFTSNIKLKEVPSCLIVQMPRFGKNFKVYSRILPSHILDVTDIIENSPRQCCICSKLATHECNSCFYTFNTGGLENTIFCEGCMKSSHQHEKRSNHKLKKVDVSSDFITVDAVVPRIFMELFAVVCIETSHYVSFVKSGPGSNAPWCFFDSMADRKGGQGGYNVPEVISVQEMSTWLTEEGFKDLNQHSVNDKFLPEHAKRLLCDAYMCMYQSRDVMMYK